MRKSLHHINRNSAKYKLWRAKVYCSDKWMCRVCNSKYRIEAHHILPIRTHPHLSLKVNNGITLCFKCHRTIFGKEEEVSSFFAGLKAKGVNSVEIHKMDNTEPSQTRNSQEGVTTRKRVFRIEQFITKKIPCSQCGLELKRHYYRTVRSKNFFCSRDCRGKWNSINLRGEKNPFWKKQPDIFCLYCKKKTSTPSDKNRRKKYCNNTCQLKYEYKNGLKKTKPYLNGRWTKKYETCIYCKTTSKRHYGKGKCMDCYNKEYNSKTVIFPRKPSPKGMI